MILRRVNGLCTDEKDTVATLWEMIIVYLAEAQAALALRMASALITILSLKP